MLHPYIPRQIYWIFHIYLLDIASNHPSKLFGNYCYINYNHPLTIIIANQILLLTTPYPPVSTLAV